MNLKRNYYYILSLNLALISFVVESVRWFLTSLHGNKTKITVAYNTITRWHHKTALECRLQTPVKKLYLQSLMLYYYVIVYYIISYHTMLCYINKTLLQISYQKFARRAC